MAGPWERYQQQAAPAGPWAKYAQQPEPEQAPVQSGPAPEPFNVLPLSEDAQGNVSFDSDAGFMGALKGLLGVGKSIATLPGDVFTGKVDPRSDEVIGRAAEFAMAATPLNPGIRAGDMAVPGLAKMLRKPDIAAPTEKELLKAGSSGLKSIRTMGVDYDVRAVKDAVQGIRSELFEDGLRKPNAPRTQELLKDFDAEGTVATASDLMSARQAFRQVAKEVDENGESTPDAVAAMRVIAGLDRFIEEPSMGAVLSGPAEGVSAALKRSNANYAAGKRSGTLTRPAANAERRAEASNSGLNIDNTIRQRIATLLEKPHKRLAGFKQPEIDELEAVSRGNRPRNALRWTGNFLGGGGGLGALAATGLSGATGAAAGGVMGGGIGALLPLTTGVSAKALGNALTKRSLDKVASGTRKRSPLYEDMLHDMPLEAISPEQRAALIRALLLSQEAPQN